MLNKPRGLVTTASDEKGRRTVYECFPGAGLPWISPVGRLDRASEGLLLFTNDSRWAARILDPSVQAGQDLPCAGGRIGERNPPRPDELRIDRSGRRLLEGKESACASEWKADLLAGDRPGRGQKPSHPAAAVNARFRSAQAGPNRRRACLTWQSGQGQISRPYRDRGEGSGEGFKEVK